jgi:hypothetical protein
MSLSRHQLAAELDLPKQKELATQTRERAT